MELQKRTSTLIRQSSFEIALRENPEHAIAQFYRTSPESLDQSLASKRKLTETLDSLTRSEVYFKDFYLGDDREKYLTAINFEIEKVNQDLTLVPGMKSIGELFNSDPEGTKTSIALLVNDLRLFFQVDNMIGDRAILSLSSLIVFEFLNLTLEEICVCFNLAKKGEYGTAYNRLDGAVIMKWLKQYNAEKQQRIIERNYSKDVQYKSDISFRVAETVSNKDLVNKAYAALEIEKTKK